MGRMTASGAPVDAGVARRLRRALDRKGGLVRLQRNIVGGDVIQGYVVAVGTKWLLLHALGGSVFLEGHCALRIADVVSVRRPANRRFVRRAIELDGQWPPCAPTGTVALDTTRGLIESLARLSPLVTVHTERRHPGICYIGVPQAYPQGSVELLDITSKASWVDKPRRWRLRDITRVEIGGPYERALYEIGGPPPQRPRRPNGPAS
jgi:hypothetical protein